MSYSSFLSMSKPQWRRKLFVQWKFLLFRAWTFGFFSFSFALTEWRRKFWLATLSNRTIEAKINNTKSEWRRRRSKGSHQFNLPVSSSRFTPYSIAQYLDFFFFKCFFFLFRFCCKSFDKRRRHLELPGRRNYDESNSSFHSFTGICIVFD